MLIVVQDRGTELASKVGVLAQGTEEARTPSCKLSCRHRPVTILGTPPHLLQHSKPALQCELACHPVKIYSVNALIGFAVYLGQCTVLIIALSTGVGLPYTD